LADRWQFFANFRVLIDEIIPELDQLFRRLFLEQILMQYLAIDPDRFQSMEEIPNGVETAGDYEIDKDLNETVVCVDMHFLHQIYDKASYEQDQNTYHNIAPRLLLGLLHHHLR
jgi:hypothetical protein